MRRKVEVILPSIANVKSFKEFQESCITSNPEIGLDNTTISKDNIAAVAKEAWEELIANASYENSIIVFQEHVELLKQNHSIFRHVVLRDSLDKCTGCRLKTASMRDNFERFSDFVEADAMKCGIKKLDWPCMILEMCNESHMICVGCE